MKKLMTCIATALMLVTVTPIQSKAKKNPTPISATETEKESAELAAITNRVNEINAMDRSTMSPSERREIRKELRALKKEATQHSGGVYISTGILVLIIVLIIVL